MKKYIALLFMLFFITSCFKGSFYGLHSGYHKESKKSNIYFVNDLSNIESFDRKSIYAVNGITLREELEKYDNSLVYFWSPYCSAESCISLEVAQTKCDENGLELFVVADCYNSEIQLYNENTNRVILTKDHLYYKTNSTYKINEKFKLDLFQKPLEDSITYFRFYKFEKGVFSEAIHKFI